MSKKMTLLTTQAYDAATREMLSVRDTLYSICVDDLFDLDERMKNLFLEMFRGSREQQI